MITSLDEFINKLEPKLNERDKKVKEHKELLKDINDFCELFPALEQVIEELEKKYLENKEDIKVKEELDSYLKEREVYWETINEFRIRAQKIEKELKNDLDATGLEDRLIYNLYDRRNLISKLRSIENKVDQNGLPVNATLRNEFGELVRIPSTEEEMYVHTLKQLETLDATIKKDYEFLLENEEFVELEDDFEVESIPEPNSNLSKVTKADLELEKEEILKELRRIEQEKGKKCYFKYSYQGVTNSVSIPKRLRGKYGSLLTRLNKIEKQIGDYIPPVKFESELYEGMTMDQQKAYLANVMLQIEARSELSFNKYYVNEKFIPYEYKDLYVEVLNKLKAHNEKKITYYTEAIDWAKAEKMSSSEKIEYFGQLCKLYTEGTKENPVSVVIDGKEFIVNESDEPAFRKCYEEGMKAKADLEREVFEFEEQNKAMEKEQEQSTTVTIRNNGQDIIIPENMATEYSKNDAQRRMLEERIEEWTLLDYLGRTPRGSKNPYYELDQKVEEYIKNPINRKKVSRKRKPSNLEKIKKALKKTTVQIAIAIGAIVTVTFASLHAISKLPKFEKIKLENNYEATPSHLVIEPETEQEMKKEETNAAAVEWQKVTNFDLTPEEGQDYVNIYGGDLNKPLKPLYPNDSYRVVTRNYKMPNGEIIKVSLEDASANQKMAELESLGGILETVDAVAKTGEEDYAKRKIPTGQFIIDDNLSPNVELDKEILDYLNEGQGRGR